MRCKWHITLCFKLYKVLIWYTYVLQNGFHLRLTPSSHHISIVSFLWWEHLRFTLSNIQVYSTVLPSCALGPQDLLIFELESPCSTLSHLPFFFFSFPPISPSFTSSSFFFFCLTLASFPLISCKDTWVFRFRLGTIVDAKEGVGSKENIDNLGKSMVLFYMLHTKWLCPSRANYSS